MPYFSIVIPAYNRADILPDTLSCLLEQTYTDWECIVVDDGSTDNSSEVVESFATEDSRIRYVYQQNAERSAARNRGAAVSKGKYILFLDSDDAYTPTHLEVLYTYLAANNSPVALILVDNWELKNSGELELPDGTHDSLETLPYLWTVPVVPVRVCIHQAIFETHRFDEKIVVVEDQVLWLHIASAYPVLRLRERTAIYRIHEGNSVSKGNNPFEKRLLGLKRMFSVPEYTRAKELIPAKVRGRMLSQCYFRIGEFRLAEGKRGKAISAFIQCQFTSPGFRWKECLYLLLKS